MLQHKALKPLRQVGRDGRQADEDGVAGEVGRSIGREHAVQQVEVAQVDGHEKQAQCLPDRRRGRDGEVAAPGGVRAGGRDGDGGEGEGRTRTTVHYRCCKRSPESERVEGGMLCKRRAGRGASRLVRV